MPNLYALHRKLLRVSVDTFTAVAPHLLDEEQRQSVDSVIDFYVGKTAPYLSDFTHAEDPWRNSRVGLAPGSTAHTIIEPADMMAYYSGVAGAEVVAQDSPRGH